MRMAWGGAFALVTFFLCACSKSVVIESNTTWSGAIGASTESVSGVHSVSGSGNAALRADDAHVCWFIQKSTSAGTLRVYLFEHSIVGTDRLSDEYTTSEFGTVAGCGG